MVAKKKLPDALNKLPIRRDDEVALRMIQGRPASRYASSVIGSLAVALHIGAGHARARAAREPKRVVG